MLGDISHVENVYIRTGYTDMRKQLDGLVDIIQYHDGFSTALTLIRTAIPCSCSAAGGQTGSRQSTMKETDSAFCTNGMKADD